MDSPKMEESVTRHFMMLSCLKLNDERIAITSVEGYRSSWLPANIDDNDGDDNNDDVMMTMMMITTKAMTI